MNLLIVVQWRDIHEKHVLLLSGVVTARPVGEQRSCWESEQHLWPGLLPTSICCSALVLLGSCSLDTSDLKENTIMLHIAVRLHVLCKHTTRVFADVNASAHKLGLTKRLKLLFKFAQMRNVQSKPIANFKENISSNTRQCVLSHIYNHHDNFIEACDVVCQNWVG